MKRSLKFFPCKWDGFLSARGLTGQSPYCQFGGVAKLTVTKKCDSVLPGWRNIVADNACKLQEKDSYITSNLFKLKKLLFMFEILFLNPPYDNKHIIMFADEHVCCNWLAS